MHQLLQKTHILKKLDEVTLHNKVPQLNMYLKVANSEQNVSF